MSTERLTDCVRCGRSKNAAVHVRRSGAFTHDHQRRDRPQQARQPLNAKSQKRHQYLKDTEYAHRSTAARTQPCALGAAGATPPGGCRGMADGLHHTLPRGRAGGLEAAERDGETVPACGACNVWVSQSTAGQRWAEEHGFLMRRAPR